MEINFLAIFVAALIPLVLGFVWYNQKVFGAAWMRATGLTMDDAKGMNMGMVFLLSFIFAFLIGFEMNVLAVHDAFVQGALYYETKGTMQVEPGSEAAVWLDQYMTKYAASNHSFPHGMFHGVAAGLLLVFPIIATNALYERRGWKYILIVAGYWIISLGLMGGLIAVWR
ncbi:MAG: DUF1761 domain-containing protein [Saprospiraceae bacterium]|nr:DUF1761 domain-containing protein [Saprospiraceae bacterium]